MKNYKTALVISLFIGAYSQSFAADPPAAPVAPAQATAATEAQPATTAAAATATATTSDTKAADAALAAQTKVLRTAGYKPRVRNGTTVWCRPETALGSRLAQVERCGTAEEIERSTLAAKETVEKLQSNVTQRQSN